MDPIIISQVRNSWYKKENELMQRRPRRYLHFDDPFKYISKSVLSKITNPQRIDKHAFLPLIQRIQSNRVFKKIAGQTKKGVLRKNRPIAYASHFDALIYSWYAAQLEHFYEKKIVDSDLNTSIIAYRKLGKSNIGFAKEVFDYIKQNKNCATLNLDIEGFYDNLDHVVLKTAWKNTLGVRDLPVDHYNVFKSITSYGYVRHRELKKLLGIGSDDPQKIRLFLGVNLLKILRKNKHKIKKNKNKKGIPQGTPISCVLSNIYMYGFDKTVLDKISSIGGLYRRYSDDIIIVCPKDKLDEIETFLCDEIKKLKLTIQTTKTETSYFQEENEKIVSRNKMGKLSNLQYLGITFNGESPLLRHKGYAKYERKMTRAIKKEIKKVEEFKTRPNKRKIYEKFSPLGKTNYISYANKAAKELDSLGIRNQVENNRIMKKINRKLRKKPLA